MFMQSRIIKILCIIWALLIVVSGIVNAEIVSQVNADVTASIVNAPSAILVEESSGQVLYELNADEKLPIANKPVLVNNFLYSFFITKSTLM